MTERRPQMSKLLWLLAILPLAAFTWPWQINQLAAAAREAYFAKEYDQAQNGYATALSAAPKQPELAYGLGATQLGGGNYTDALATLDRALDLAETDELKNHIHYDRGNAFYRLNQIESAAQEYEKALEYDPNDADAAHNLALCRRKLNQQQNQQNGEGGEGGEQGEQQNEPQQGQNGETSDNRQSQSQPAPFSEDDVDRVLEALRQDEQDFRTYFKPHPGMEGDPGRDIDAQLRGFESSGFERDW